MADHSRVRSNLLSEYLPNSHGMWKIYGEDPNAEMSGAHNEPLLDIVSGTYKNVVEFALTLPNFFQWGRGGRIIKLAPPTDVDKAANDKLQKLKDERHTLQARLNSIDAEIDSIYQK